MAAPELLITGPEAAAAVAPASPTRFGLLTGYPAYLAAAALGVGGTYVGADGLDSRVSVGFRVVLVVVGLWLLLRGAQAALSRRRGQPVDLGFWVALGWLVVLVAAAATADLLPLGEASDVSKTLTSPTLLTPDLWSAHPLGTDRQGLDLLAGVIYGARISLVVGFCAVLIGTVVGGLTGLLVGYYRGLSERVVGILTDAMLAFPPLILLLAMVAVLEPSVRNVTLALGVLIIPTYIRLVRANVLTVSEREFVTAARALGARNRHILLREVMPNIVLPVLSYGFVLIAVLIVAEASLSFLGLSIPRPNPTWGNLIAAGQSDFERYPHLVFVPGVILFVTVFALNRVGDRLRAWWAPS